MSEPKTRMRRNGTTGQITRSARRMARVAVSVKSWLSAMAPAGTTSRVSHHPEPRLDAASGARGVFGEVVVERDAARRQHLERLRAHQRAQGLEGAALALAQVERGDARRRALA